MQSPRLKSQHHYLEADDLEQLIKLFNTSVYSSMLGNNNIIIIIYFLEFVKIK